MLCSIRLFADDCLLYRHIKTNEDTTSLQDDINSLQDWERDWQMHFNPDKGEVIRITTKRKIIPSKLDNIKVKKFEKL
jgi:hypothetical protein